MKTPRPDSGFSLIEVIVALGLLAAVLLSVSGLFIRGSQSVNSGRDLTEATSLATDIVEQMDKWGFTQLYTNFGVANTSGAFTVTSLVKLLNGKVSHRGAPGELRAPAAVRRTLTSRYPSRDRRPLAGTMSLNRRFRIGDPALGTNPSNGSRS